ncbi:MAG: hypothetical protein JW795_19995 [Chitinivibrionales bacterium]|nr:hypothetical protein [Chitinivibrionales bacterium]
MVKYIVEVNPNSLFPMRLIAISLFFIGLIALKPYGGEKSFFVPEDHEKFPLIDSLYNEFIRFEETMKSIELRLISNTSIRNQQFVAKQRYVEALLQSSSCTREKAMEYFTTAKHCFEAKTRYFHELMSIVDEDTRPNCVALWKKARDNCAAATMACITYDVDTQAPTIQFGDESNDIEQEPPGKPRSKVKRQK